MKKGILILLLCIVTSSGIYAQIGSKVDMDNIAASVIMQTWTYDAESFFPFVFDLSSGFDDEFVVVKWNRHGGGSDGFCAIRNVDGLVYSDSCGFFFRGKDGVLRFADQYLLLEDSHFYEPMRGNQYAPLYDLSDNSVDLNRNLFGCHYCLTDEYGRIINYYDVTIMNEQLRNSNRKYIPEYVWNITYADNGYLDKMQCEFNNGIVKIDIDWSEKQIKYQRTYSLKCPVNEAPIKD